MTARNPAPPKYRHYTPKDLAVVRIDGKDHDLGKFGSPESREKYHRLLAEHASGAIPKSSEVGPAAVASALTVSELILAYWWHAQAYYRKPDGRPTGEVDNVKLPLRQLYGSTPAAEFGPLALKAVRRAMVDFGLARTTVNQRVGKIVRAFRWAVENEMVPPSSHHALAAVPGLRKGRTEAPEPGPIRPVADADGDAIRPFVTRQAWAMVELQRLAGMRSGEVTSIRTGDVDRSGEVWAYTPREHKGEHHGQGRRIYLGPKASAVLRPWLRDDPNAFLFQPREAVEEWKAAKRSARKSPLTPSQRARVGKARPARAPGDRYESRAYAHAIARACERAFPHPTLATLAKTTLTVEQRADLEAWRRSRRWHPHRIRHAAAT